ncbi:MAG: flagellar hook-basal body protein [Clostridiales bacterium]|nr:flagellar hook-basal body protein [Clostridiales bacterium]
MYQGFYNLASGMLTQSRNLNVISNNMVNVQTAGYKRDRMLTSTFDEEMLYRTGTQKKGNPVPLAVTSKIKTASETHVDYEQGSYERTDGLYDFAIGGRGFFCVETGAGEGYTRNGSFAVDEEGYLITGENARVLSAEGGPIRIPNENFTVDSRGRITADTGDGGEAGENGGTLLGTLKVVDFADYNQLHKEDNGMFSSAAAPVAVQEGDTAILWKSVEKSNVDMVEEMTAMMASQRALQSAAQMLKMYDQIMGKSVADIGRV